MVEPGDVGDDARIVALGAEGRDEHRRAAVDERARARQTPSPGSGCAKTGLIRGGHAVRARVGVRAGCAGVVAGGRRRPPAALFSCGPPFFGAFQL